MAAEPRGGVHVEAWLGDECIARCAPLILRPDVAHARPGLAGGATSGFAFDLSRAVVEGDFLGELRIVARPV